MKKKSSCRFHSPVRPGTWKHNNGNWDEDDVVRTDTRAHGTVSRMKYSQFSFSDHHVVKQYKRTRVLVEKKNRGRSVRKKLFEI